MPHTYEYPRPAAVDAVVFGFDDQDLKVLLIQRGVSLSRGSGQLRAGSCAWRSRWRRRCGGCGEETGLANVFLEQLYTFGQTGRDPRAGGWCPWRITGW